MTRPELGMCVPLSFDALRFGASEPAITGVIPLPFWVRRVLACEALKGLKPIWGFRIISRPKKNTINPQSRLVSFRVPGSGGWGWRCASWGFRFVSGVSAQTRACTVETTERCRASSNMYAAGCNAAIPRFCFAAPTNIEAPREAGLSKSRFRWRGWGDWTFLKVLKQLGKPA